MLRDFISESLCWIVLSVWNGWIMDKADVLVIIYIVYLVDVEMRWQQFIELRLKCNVSTKLTGSMTTIDKAIHVRQSRNLGNK